MPQTITTGGPPGPPPNFGGYGPRRRKSGFWARFGQQGFGFKLNVIGSFLGILAIIGWFVWRFLIPHSPPTAAAQETIPTPTETRTFATVDLNVPQIETSEFTPTVSPPGDPANPPDLQATATFQAAISRPASANNPGAYPNYIGVITYESGCSVSNLGFTTSGYNGAPFYLYFSGLLDRDPLMQMVQIRGYVQEFDGCQYPVLMVQEVFWLSQTGTPAPLAYGGQITDTITGTITAANPSTWGHGDPMPTKTPTYTVWIPPQKELPPLATYTPYPTYTPQPVQQIVQTVIPHIPTYTPYPTYTPDPSTPTPTATATPETVTIYGPVVAVGGCAVSNFAIQTSGQNYFIIFDGAQLPPGEPTQYLALATGFLDTACSGQAIRAKQITWYEVTPTPTMTPTLTPTLTPTPILTPTLTPTATITPTEVITP